MKEKFKIIRGEKLLQILSEMTYNELERNTLNFTPPSTKRQHAMDPVQIQRIELMAARPSGVLECTGMVNSGGNQYQSMMVFRDVVFEDEDTQSNITFTAADNQDYHIQPISLSHNNVKVRCTCLDFRWRFAMHNQKHDALHGEGPDLYQKKTNRPPNNPGQVAGLCKHLLKFAVELRNSGIVTQ